MVYPKLYTILQIEQLQLRLQQEKSMRNMLERAMGRASSTLSPGHRHFSVQVVTKLFLLSFKELLQNNPVVLRINLGINVVPSCFS